MLVAGFDGVISAVNPAWMTTLGWSEHELLSRNFLDLVHPDDLIATQNAAAALCRQVVSFGRFDNRYRHKDGSYRDITWTAAPGDGPDHRRRPRCNRRTRTRPRPYANRGSASPGAEDGSSRSAHRWPRARLQQPADRHDGQPRTATAPRRARPTGRSRPLRQCGQGAGRRAASLTQRLLAFSRRQTLDPKPTDVNRLITGMEEMLPRTVGPTIDIEIVGAVGLWTAEIDPGQLENAV